MNKSIAVLTRLVWFGACVIGLASPIVARATDVDLGEPVTITPGKGIAVFSITFKCNMPNPMSTLHVKWRAVGGDKIYAGDGRSGEITTKGGLLFGTEEFSNSPRQVWGRLAGLSLPPGTYEFYGFRKVVGNGNNGNAGSTFLSSRREFSRRFTVEPGKVQYVGSLDICEGHAFFGGGGIFAGLMIGAWVGSVDVFPSLHDAGDLDLPMLFAKANGLNAADVLRNVTVDETDRHMQGLVDDLRRKSEQGDVSAQRSLLLGLVNGWGMTETGEEFKMMKNAELEQQLADQLSARGISGGAYALGLLQVPDLANNSTNLAPATAVNPQVLGYFIADAERYFPDAMSRIVLIRAFGLAGVNLDKETGNLWSDRLDAMSKLATDSIPYLDVAGKTEFEKFSNASLPRYFALSASGAYGMSKGDDASAQAAIAACEARNAGAVEHCRLYAENRGVVWNACTVEYVGPQATTFPPVTGLGKISDTTHLPANLNDAAKASYRDFLAARMPRAFAVSDTGEVGMASGDCHSAYKALQACSQHAGKTCQLYALDDQIVLGATDPKLVEQQQRLAALVEKASQGTAKLASQSVLAVKQIEAISTGGSKVEEKKY